MKKTILLIMAIQFSIAIGFSQVGVNTTDPQGALHIESTTTGLVPPRVQLTSLIVEAPVVNPSAATSLLPGTIVWNIAAAGVAPNNVVPGLYIWDSSKWVLMSFADGDFHDVTHSKSPTAITEDVYRTGKVAIGKTTAASALDIVDNTSNDAVRISTSGSSDVLELVRTGSKSNTSRGLYVNYQNDDSGSNSQQAINIWARGGTGTGRRVALQNNVHASVGNTREIVGVYNNTDTGAGNHWGFFNNLTSNENGNRVGVYNNIGVSGAGNGLHIGIDNDIDGTGTGVHYGVRNKVHGNGETFGTHNTVQALGPNVNATAGYFNASGASGTGVNYAAHFDNGRIKMSSLPAYANNAAAIAGGLAVGDLYYVPTNGNVRVRY